MINKLMKKNIGQLDKIIRIILGLGLLSLTFLGPKSLFGLIGLIPLGTALLNTCPLYTVFGMSTCSVKLDK